MPIWAIGLILSKVFRSGPAWEEPCLSYSGKLLP